MLKSRPIIINNKTLYLFIDSKTSECVQKNTEDDNIIIVTDSFIRELNNEFQIVKTNSQGIKLVFVILYCIIVFNLFNYILQLKQML